MTKTVAIVDDDASVRDATQNLVRSLGLAVRSFASAEDLLAVLPTVSIDCVITDVQMGGLGGVELTAALRCSGRTIPVIFITAFPDEHVRARALAVGGIGFLCKPFESRTLIGLIERALS
ncbi:two-component system response regulator [Bosea sp. Tri-44]|uniref:response regulator transcription factor n=1 Tax=Bosea sp. Tri-44 TaxID=1972137 RepID=UPI00100EB28B|nr:response regulator [Bosea sp. Tri-44]RXT56395.1 two-component system response regulator [Bosea sp. Tri-44]